jgi:hypothetical protein
VVLDLGYKGVLRYSWIVQYMYKDAGWEENGLEMRRRKVGVLLLHIIDDSVYKDRWLLMWRSGIYAGT